MQRRNALKEESSQIFEDSIDDHQQQQQQQLHHREENNHHRPDQQQEVRDNFVFIELRAENSRRFRNFAILGKEAIAFAIRQPSEGTDIVRWIENAFREIRMHYIRANRTIT